MTTDNDTDLESLHIGNRWSIYESVRLKKRKGRTTGFAHIDKAMVVLPGFINILGDTNCGKSTLLMNIFAHNALKGVPVLLCDNENGLTLTRTRLLCHIGQLTPEAVESGKFFGDEERRYTEAVNTLVSLPIYYLDRLDEEQIEKAVRELGKKYQKPVVLVVDSLNAFISGKEDERSELTRWVNFFNTLKNQLENWINIIMVTEKRKEDFGSGNNRGAKGAGSIDYRVEFALHLYPTKDKKGTIVAFEKNRFGPKGIITTLRPSNPFTYTLEEVGYGLE